LVINADREVPDKMVKEITDEAQQAGFLLKNIYLTAIDRSQFAIGLVRQNNR
jgi:hypothetical protein